MKFAVVNLGCKVNRVESDNFERIIIDGGAELCDPVVADVVVVNTCTVTSVADKKTRKTVRSILSANPNCRVIVTGCAAARESCSFSEMSDRVEIVEKSGVVGLLSSMLAPTASNAKSCAEHTSSANDKVRKGVKIQDGCTNACTYCIIWQVRGPLWSAPIGDVVRDVMRLHSEGVSEIILTGINLGRYIDLESNVNLVELLRILLELDLPVRYRLSSIEPPEVTQELVDLIASSDGKICRHLHIPLQSGSAKVLSEMRRLYSPDNFLDTVRMIRNKIPTISLTTDVIVGFPGESDSDFEDTLSVVRQCGFSKVHVFPYSPREATAAATRDDQIEASIKGSRAKKLRDLSDALRNDDLKRRKGSTEQAVVIADNIALTESFHEVTLECKYKIGDLIEIKHQNDC